MAFAHHPPALPSLRCRDLKLPRPICIWFVRRTYHAGVEATERTLTPTLYDGLLAVGTHYLCNALTAALRYAADADAIRTRGGVLAGG